MQVDDKYRVYNEILMWSASMPLPNKAKKSKEDFPKLDFIAKCTFELLGVSEYLNVKTRKEDAVFAKHVATSIAHSMKQYTGWNLNQIGKMTGRDHASALHSLGVINNSIDTKFRYNDVLKVANEFDVSVDELYYYKSESYDYSGLKATSKEGTAVFKSLRDAARNLKSDPKTILRYLNSGNYFRGKYKLTHDNLN